MNNILKLSSVKIEEKVIPLYATFNSIDDCNKNKMSETGVLIDGANLLFNQNLSMILLNMPVANIKITGVDGSEYNMLNTLCYPSLSATLLPDDGKFTCYSPVPFIQKFIWYAIYEDDTFIKEYENNGKKHDPDEIKNSEVKEFGILGNGGRIYFNTKDGLIYHRPNMFISNITINYNGKDYNILNKDKSNIADGVDYHNLTELKLGHSDASINPGHVSSQKLRFTTDEIMIGYKGVLKEADINYEVYIILPIKGGRLRLSTSISSTSHDMEQVSVKMTSTNGSTDTDQLQNLANINKGITKKIEMVL